MIKAVIFDIDNTLYSFDRAHITAMDALLQYGGKKLDLDSEFMREGLKKTQQRIIDRLGTGDSGIHNRLIRFQCFLESLHLDLEKALEMYHVYWDTILNVMEPEPGVKELITALRSDGISVGIGSDMTAYIQYKKLLRLGVLKDLSFIVTSEEAGAEKPSPEFFRLCVEKAGCLPEECAFIGDSLKKDVIGAGDCGLHGIWYCPEKEGPGETPGAYPAIRSFKDCLKDGKTVNEIFDRIIQNKGEKL